MFRFNAVPDRKRKIMQIAALLSCEPVFKSVHCPELASKFAVER